PQGLPLKPSSTLYERARGWLNENYAALDDEDQQADRNLPVDTEFPDGPSRRHIDILIVTSHDLDTVGELRFTPGRVLHTSRLRVQELMAQAPSPSEAVKDVSGLRRIFCGNAAFVHGGRPAYNYGPPPALFHSALAKLDYHLSHLDEKWDELTIDADFLYDVHRFIDKSLAIYDSEDIRLQELKDIIDSLAGPGGEPHVILFEGAKPDIMWYHPCLSMIQENINEFGIGGDAFVEAVVSYARVVGSNAFTRRRQTLTNHPAVVIGLMGHFIEFGSVVSIGGDVYYGRSYSQKLYLGFHGHKDVLRLAKAFRAVQLATKSIRDFHTSLATHRPLGVSIEHLFPSPTPLDGTPLPVLAFKCRLSRTGRRYIHPRNEDEVRSAMYIATLQVPAASGAVESSSVGTSVEVAVKFTARYGVAAHELLAKQGLAPILYACRPVLGDLYMVVMEFVSGKTAWNMIESCEQIPHPVWADVQKAIEALHEKDLVFGDLRLPNIMCVPTESGGMRAKLVDFDWAGIHGKDRYPTTMNAQLKDWAPGMDRYEIMLKDHDRQMLEKLPFSSA
ncbi:hypothetical protein BD311DRAFT_678300, partial [Dichomitus squalens]